ncbi:MAG TPA: hypothetical protein VFD27_04695, partial [Chthoniobacteraceae bacterium]|nr:hypothetical protein [Chthoniobacteraceae bacterium]
MKKLPPERRLEPARIERLEARIAPATFTVKNLHDAGAGSLRNAIDQANDASGADEIVFKAGLHGKLNLDSVLEITDSVTIDGPGRLGIVISGQAKTQLFAINGDGLEVSISNFLLKKGRAENGGAIAIDNPNGTVTIAGCTLEKNIAAGARGDAETLDGGSAAGGALYVAAGALDLKNSKLTGNQARGGNGFTETRTYDDGYGEITYDVEYSGGDASGGALFVDVGATANISESRIKFNTAIGGRGLGVSGGYGGGIANAGEVTISSSKIKRNEASGALLAQGGGLHNWGTASLDEVTVAGNQLGAIEGAKGVSVAGGGIFNGDGQTLTIQHSTISGNVGIASNGYRGADGAKGYNGPDGEDGPNGDRGSNGYDGYAGYSGGSGYDGYSGGYGGSALGGGIYNAGTLTLMTSVISGNQMQAGKGGNGGDGGRGGRGGDGGDGGNGGPACNAYGYHYPGGYGGSGGDGGYGGNGGSGGAGGGGG